MKCKNCGHHVGTPSGTNGLIVLAAATAAVIVFILFPFMGWGRFLISFITFLLIVYLPGILTYLKYGFSDCKKCGSRTWSFPFTEGFGM